MNDLKVQHWAGAFGIATCVLLIVAFPLYYPFVRALMRSRDTSKMSTRKLSLLDKFDLALEYELNKRMRNLGVGLYRLTGGRIVRFAKAAGVMILTTRGRRSGKARTVLLQCFQDGANWIIVAANSGRSSHPDWFYNLKATPTAQVQVMDRTLQVRAEELSPEETAAFWPRILRVAPTNARYQQATSRPIPLVRLVPINAEEQPMPSGEALPGREELSFAKMFARAKEN